MSMIDIPWAFPQRRARTGLLPPAWNDPVSRPGFAPTSSRETSRSASMSTSLAPAAPWCHPGLVPGSRKAGRQRCLTVWTPEQVRGDNGGATGTMAGNDDAAGGLQSVSRPGAWVGDPPIPTPCPPSRPFKQDSSGTSPAMTKGDGGSNRTGQVPIAITATSRPIAEARAASARHAPSRGARPCAPPASPSRP